MTSKDIRIEINRLKEKIEFHEGYLGSWILQLKAERRDLRILEEHLNLLTEPELPLATKQA